MFSSDYFCSYLPDDIFYELVYIYRVFSAGAKMFDEPFFGLEVNGFFEVVDPFSAQADLSRDSLLTFDCLKTWPPTLGGYGKSLKNSIRLRKSFRHCSCILTGKRGKSKRN